MIAMKFGGTSVGNVEAFAQVAKIVADAVGGRPYGTARRSGCDQRHGGRTNLLIEAARRAADGDEILSGSREHPAG